MLFREYISLLLTWFSFKLWEKWEGLQCHGCLVHFVNNAIYTSLFAIILNLQMEKLQLHVKHICLLRNIAKSPNNKIKFEKKCYANTFSKFVVVIHFNLLQVCPSVPQVFHFLCYLSLLLMFWVITLFIISQFDDSSRC